MIYLFAAIVWPLAFVGLYFIHPVAFPSADPLDGDVIFFTALLGMAAFTFAGALRILGFLRNDQVRKEKGRTPPPNFD